jgi:PAS domain S-box-containing protein
MVRAKRNEGAERIKGYTDEEILGNHFSTFYTRAQREAGLPEQLLEQAQEAGSVKRQGPRVRKDGSTFDAGVTITAVYDEDDTLRGYGKVTRDLTTPTS